MEVKNDGSKSRRKGKRCEYLLRDEVRKIGYTANRVPSSGASQGFKGDVTYAKGETKGTLELKARKDEYNTIYALYDTFKDSSGKLSLAIGEGDLVLVSLTPDLDTALSNNFVFKPSRALQEEPGWVKVFSRTLNKLVNLRKLIGESNVLVIKTDRRPFLYISYR